jgi:hypothetical protein
LSLILFATRGYSVDYVGLLGVGVVLFKIGALRR